MKKGVQVTKKGKINEGSLGTKLKTAADYLYIYVAVSVGSDLQVAFEGG